MERASQSCDRQEESPKVFLPFQDLHFRQKVKIWFQWANWAASGPWMWKLIALSLDSLKQLVGNFYYRNLLTWCIPQEKMMAWKVPANMLEDKLAPPKF